MTPLSKKLFLLILGLFALVFDSSAQLDTKHWIPPFYAKPGPGSGTSNIRKHFVSLSTPAIEPIQVTIRDGFGDLVDVVEISRNLPLEYEFSPIGNGSTQTYPLNVIPTDSLNMPIRSQGLYFESFQPFFVNMRHKSGSQGTSLTSKGQVGLGERFYSGHIFTIYNNDEVWNNERRSHFISVMATEDNTTVTFDMVKDPIAFIGHTAGEEVTITLDAFESYVVGVDHSLYDNETINNANGTRIKSDKPIVCNSGSWLAGNQSGQCIGSDQLVPAEVTGQEYILVKGLGDESTERPMVVATENNTDIYINEELNTPAATLDEGEFYIIPTESFSDNDNMYVLSSEKVYMFQTLSGSSSNIGPTVGLNFIPPLNCVGAKEVNLPFVNSLAAGNGQGRINIITKAGTSIFVNDNADPLTGADPVPGNTDWVSYAFDTPSNNVNIVSDSVMNVALLTRDEVVGTAGYFSGFTLEPVVGLSSDIPGSLPCIPGNAVLQVFGFDAYQWYFNGDEIEGATGPTLFPEFSGAYSVEGIDLACGFRFPSNPFDIPFCPSTLGAAKEVVNVEETSAGSRIFDISYRIYIENLNESAALNIQVLENIEGGLPAGATAELIGGPSLVFGALSGSINPTFDGTDDSRLLPGNGSLPGEAGDAIDLTIRIDMNEAEQDGYFDQVTVTSKNEGTNNGLNGPFNGQDFSDEGNETDTNGNGEPNEEGENDPTLTCFFTNEISYDALTFCQSSEPEQITIDGVSSGLFTSDNLGLSIDGETGDVNPSESEPGTYTVTFTVEGRCPTVTSTEISIIEVPHPGDAVAPQEFCVTQEEILLNDLLEGEEEGGTWFDAQGNEVSEVFEPSIAGNFEFTYELESAPCPVESETVAFNIVAEPVPGTSVADPSVCEDVGTINLFDFIEENQSGGEWFDQSGSSISENVDITNSGLFEYTYEVENDACGARSSALILNAVALPNSGIAEQGLSVCQGEEIDLNSFLIDEDTDGLWTDNDGDEVDSLIALNTLGTNVFSYTVSNAPCEPASTELEIEVTAGPNAGQPNNPVAVCEGDDAFNLITLMPGATPGGNWTNNNGDPVNDFFDPITAGTFAFTYTVTSADCGFISSELIISVSAENCIEEEVIIPQGFSPNNDGRGDMWEIAGLLTYPNNRLLVYNRWGGQVYSAQPYQSDWDGKPSDGGNSGEVLPVGTYYYVLDLGDGSEPRSGYVYLNR